MTKEELDSLLRALDIWIIVFGVLVAVGVTGEAVVGFIHFRKSGQLQRLQAAENLTQQAEIERLKKESGLILERAATAERGAAEANRKAEEEHLARLRIEERLAPRSLTVEQIHMLESKLRPYAGQPVEIEHLVGDVESQAYATELGHALASAGWSVGLGRPMTFNFSGLAVRVQDPTSVPEAAEALAKTIEAMGITVQRIHTTNKVEISMDHPSRGFDLWVSKKGGATPFARRPMPLRISQMGEAGARGNPEMMSDEELILVARETARAMREFESANQEQLGNEWRVENQPIAPGSYRDVFEQFRSRAVQIRDELLKRSHGDKATTIALDADTLVGASPITDAANYLDSLANKLVTSPK